MAEELSRLGLNLNLAPCVDLDLGSPVISGHSRSYESDPEKVVTYSRAFVAAHRQFGVLTCLKHFPGHGSALQDSHAQLVDITQEWDPAELIPFEELVRSEDADFIVRHLVHRQRRKFPNHTSTQLIVILRRKFFTTVRSSG